MSGQEVFLTEYLPEGTVEGKRTRTKLVGVFTDLDQAEREMLKIYVEVSEIFWNGIDVRWVDKPKGRFLISNDGTFTFGRIRKIELNAKVDSPLSIW